MYITISLGHKFIDITSYKDLSINSLYKQVQFLNRDFQKYNFAIKKIIQSIKEISNNANIEGIVISLTGSLDPVEGVIFSSTSYPYWDGYSPVKELRDEFNTEVIMENDAVISGLGEKLNGEGQNVKSVGCIFFSSGAGIGAMRVTEFEDNLLVYPVEVGHLVVVPDGELCDCGQRGCLETYASPKAFSKMYDLNPDEIDDEALIVAARYFTQALIAFLIFHPVEKLIFTGELAKQHNTFLKKLIKSTETMLQKKFKFEIPQLLISEFKDQAIQVGCLAFFGSKDKVINMKSLKN